MENTYCSNKYHIDVYPTLFEAQTACSQNSDCKTISDTNCKRRRYITCSGTPQVTSTGKDCGGTWGTWVKGSSKLLSNLL